MKLSFDQEINDFFFNVEVPPEVNKLVTNVYQKPFLVVFKRI